MISLKKFMIGFKKIFANEKEKSHFQQVRDFQLAFEQYEGYERVIVGVSPSISGDSSLIFRQGNKVFDLQYYDFDDLMKLTNVCVKILNSDNPKVDQMNIDVAGFGIGLFDKLYQLGYKNRVVKVNFSKNTL